MWAVPVLLLALFGARNWQNSRFDSGAAAQERADQLLRDNPDPKDRQCWLAGCCTFTAACVGPVACVFLLWWWSAGLGLKETYAKWRRDFGIAMRTTTWAPLAVAAMFGISMIVAFFVEVTFSRAPNCARPGLFGLLFLVILGYCTISSTTCETGQRELPVPNIEMSGAHPRCVQGTGQAAAEDMERGGIQAPEGLAKEEPVKTLSLQTPGSAGELRPPDDLPPPSGVANDDGMALSANPLSGTCAEPYLVYRLNLETGAMEQVPGE